MSPKSQYEEQLKTAEFNPGDMKHATMVKKKTQTRGLSTKEMKERAMTHQKQNPNRESVTKLGAISEKDDGGVRISTESWKVNESFHEEEDGVPREILNPQHRSGADSRKQRYLGDQDETIDVNMDMTQVDLNATKAIGGYRPPLSPRRSKKGQPDYNPMLSEGEDEEYDQLDAYMYKMSGQSERQKDPNVSSMEAVKFQALKAGAKKVEDDDSMMLGENDMTKSRKTRENSHQTNPLAFSDKDEQPKVHYYNEN